MLFYTKPTGLIAVPNGDPSRYFWIKLRGTVIGNGRPMVSVPLL